jgi:hypothetical protein
VDIQRTLDEMNALATDDFGFDADKGLKKDKAALARAEAVRDADISNKRLLQDFGTSSNQEDKWLRLGEVLAAALDSNLTETETIAKISGAELPRDWTPLSAARLLTHIKQTARPDEDIRRASYNARVELLNRELEIAALKGTTSLNSSICLQTNTDCLQMKSDISKRAVQLGESPSSRARSLTLQLSTESLSTLQ